jgi:ribonuclease HII
LAFVRDADGSNLLVGLASLVGKYLRDLLMRRITWFYRAQAPELPEASGYHDPVTKAFVAQTQAQRRKLRIADDCFARRKAL